MTAPTSRTQPLDKAKLAALGRIVGQPVADVVAEHLDRRGLDQLIATLGTLPADQREAQIAELQTWSKSQP